MNKVFSARWLSQYPLIANTCSGALLFVMGDGIQQRIEMYSCSHKQLGSNNNANIFQLAEPEIGVKKESKPSSIMAELNPSCEPKYVVDPNYNVNFMSNSSEEPRFDKERMARIFAIGIFEGPTHYYFYKWLDVWLPGTSKLTIIKKILCDQFIACPTFNIQFFVGMGLLEGKTWKEAWREFFTKFPTVYLVDWLVWPLAQWLNFGYVKAIYRVLFVNCVTVTWNIFLSYMKHYDQKPAVKQS